MAKPTVVLVHGAFADAGSWWRLYGELAGGHHFWQRHNPPGPDAIAMIAPPNPLRGITAGDSDYLKSVIAEIDGPVVLVGHSYGGAVITAAGNTDQVVGLVYVAGFAPDEGEDLGGLQAKFPPPVAGPFITPHELPGGGQEFTIGVDGFHQAFCADLPENEAGFMAHSQRPLSGVAFGEKAGAAAWKSKPCWAVLPTSDGAIHPDVHEFSYSRMEADITRVQGASHVVMLSQPGAVAEVIRAAVNSCAV